jgi:PAS domain S-box-containing protein
MKAEQDVVDHKEMEEEYKAVLRAALDGFWLVDVQGRLLDVNDAYCRLIGYSREELLKMHVQDIEGLKSSEQTVQHIYRIRELGRDRFETRHRHKDGRLLDIEVSADYIDANGGRIFAFLRDITGRKRMAEELRRSEQQWRILFDHTLDGIVLCDPKSGKVVLTNQAAADIFGFGTPERIIGTTLLERIPEEDEDREQVARVFTKDISSNLHKVRDFRVRTEDGRMIWISVLPTMTSYQGEPAVLLSVRDITAPKQAEEALRESEQKFKQIFTNVNDEIVFVDLTGKVLDVNERATDISGYSRDEVIGRNVAELPIFSPETLARMAELMAKASEVQGVAEPLSEITVIHKDGHQMYVQVSSCPIRGAQGELVGFCAIIRDITERKRIEMDLRMRTHAMTCSLNAIAVLDAEGRFMYVNPSFLELWGFDSDVEVLGKSLLETTAFSLEKGSLPKITETLMRGGSWLGEVKATRFKDGSKLTVLLSASLVRDEAGRHVGFVASFTDISDLKKTQEELASFSSVFEIATEGISIVNLDGTIRETNDAALRFFGEQDKKNVLGRNIMDFIPPQEKERTIAGLQGVMGSGHVPETELQIIADDGRSLTVAVSGTLVRDDGGNPKAFVALYRDITDRKKAEKALERQAEELARSNKELQTFAYVASHDLQEPLRMVSSYVQLLARRYKGKLDADADDFINYAVDGASRMQTMINDLLAYSRVGTRRKPPEPTDSQMAVSRAIAILQRTIEEKGAVVTSDPLPTVMADPAQLVQVFQNLISNAIKFHGNEPPHIHVSAEKRPDEWLFSVRDNGIGIEPQYHERIFVMFQRLHTREEYPGTGIGLAICKRIVEQHGKRIWVESEPGHGATFHFTMPIVGGTQ